MILATRALSMYCTSIKVTAGSDVVAVHVGPVICLLSMAEGAKRMTPSDGAFTPPSQSAAAC